jgi:mRNA-degrading endonuclease RelE of RelBE toxin-antitoxin system
LKLLVELNKKILKIQNNPNIGKNLSGNLKGYSSIRLLKKYRLIFRIDKTTQIIYLINFDHRKAVYK